MEKFKGKYRSDSIRLKGYDYTSSGLYFITICTKDRLPLFGNIIDGKMTFSNVGSIVEQYWKQIPEHFNNILLDEFIIMPNHIHGIIIIEQNGYYPNLNKKGMNNSEENLAIGGITGKNNPMLSENSLSKIIRWYKGRCTFEINKLANSNYFNWQPSFFEKIIQDEKTLNNVRQYIINNPLKWEIDKENHHS